jgi:hypothetical protein
MDEQIEKRLIDGNYTSGKKILARCHLLAHRGYLSKALIKSHDCLGKKCSFFQKINPEYWMALEAAERKKRRRGAEKRLQIKKERKARNDRDEFIRETLEDSGHIHVTSIQEEGRWRLKICYICDRHVNLAEEVKFLKKKLKKGIRIQVTIAPDENIEQLIRKPRRETREVHDLGQAPLVGEATKKRLASLGVYCLEDLFGRSADRLYTLDCERSQQAVSRRYLTAYRSAVLYANTLE